MTADGYCVDPIGQTGQDVGAGRVVYVDPEWQERHADLAATLRTVLAMCAHTEQGHPGGPAYLARSIREVIEQATEWPGR